MTCGQQKNGFLLFYCFQVKWVDKQSRKKNIFYCFLLLFKNICSKTSIQSCAHLWVSLTKVVFCRLRAQKLRKEMCDKFQQKLKQIFKDCISFTSSGTLFYSRQITKTEKEKEVCRRNSSKLNTLMMTRMRMLMTAGRIICPNSVKK